MSQEPGMQAPPPHGIPPPFSPFSEVYMDGLKSHEAAVRDGWLTASWRVEGCGSAGPIATDCHHLGFSGSRGSCSQAAA